MHNVYTEFKKYLQFLPIEDQLLEIDLFIDHLNNNNCLDTNVKKKYNRIQQLKKTNAWYITQSIIFYHK